MDAIFVLWTVKTSFISQHRAGLVCCPNAIHRLIAKAKENDRHGGPQACTCWEVLSSIWMDHRHLVIHLSQQKKPTQGEEANAKYSCMCCLSWSTGLYYSLRPWHMHEELRTVCQLHRWASNYETSWQRSPQQKRVDKLLHLGQERSPVGPSQ